MRTLALYARLVRFSHTVFALPFALMAAFLAGRGQFGSGFARGAAFWQQLGMVLVCMVSARSAAMAFNRIVDRRFDAANPRAADRPLVTGELSLRSAKSFYLACCGIFLAGCAVFYAAWGNPWPILLGPAMLAFVSLYSLTKRFTATCHLALGVADGLAPVAAWLAISPGSFGWPAGLMGLAVACWVAGFDIIYALPDRQLDRQLGLHSMPLAIGPRGALWVSRKLHVIALISLLLVWSLSDGLLGWLYLAGVGAAAAVLAAEQWMVRAEDPARLNAAFFWANALLSVLMGATAIADVLT